jgi:hypothetical protein
MASIDWSTKIGAYLNLGTDTLGTRGELLADIGASVQAAIEQRIGRHLDKQVHTDVLDGNGRRMLYLPWDPVLSVASVDIDGLAIDLTDRVIVRDRAGLIFTDGSLWPLGVGNVTVTYTAGYDVPPADLVHAGVRWGAGIFRARDRVGMTSTGAAGQTTSFTEDPPKWLERVIAAHVRWDKA